MNMATIIPVGVLLLIGAVVFLGVIALIVVGIVFLVKYLRKKENGTGNAEMRQSLGEALKEQRLRCQMTQEFVANAVGVSRQAVSKWENGTSEPTTTNLCALSKLYGVAPEELLRGIKTE